MLLGPFEGCVLLREVQDGDYYLPITCDEFAVVVGKPKETLYFLDVCWPWPFQHCLDLVLTHLHSSSSDDVSKEFDCCFVELAFFWCNRKIPFLEFLQYQSH